MGKLTALVYRNRKKVLSFLGISAFLDLLKEYMRGRLMEWFVDRLGVFGLWLFANPFALMTFAVGGMVLVFAAVLLFESVDPETSQLYDYAERKLSRSREGKRWGKTFSLSCLGLLLLVLAGFYLASSTMKNADNSQIASHSEKSELPQIEAEIDQLTLYKEGFNHQPMAFLWMWAKNKGKPTILTDFKLEISEPDGSTINGYPATIGSPWVLRSAVPNSPAIVITEDDNFVEKTAKPITPGDEPQGVLCFVFSGYSPETIFQKGSTWKVTFFDYLDKQWDTSTVYGSGVGSAMPIPLPGVGRIVPRSGR